MRIIDQVISVKDQDPSAPIVNQAFLGLIC